MLGNNMFAYCNNDPVNHVDYSGEEPLTLTAAMGIGLVVFTIGFLIYDLTHEQVLGQIFVEGINALGEALDSAINREDVPKSIFSDTEDSLDDRPISEIKTKDDYDPDPYRRPGQKKQGKSLKNKARKSGNWTPRNNKRDGKPAKPKPHTPNRDHRKYGNSNKIDIFGGPKR